MFTNQEMELYNQLEAALFPSERLNLSPLCADEMLELVEIMLDAEIIAGRTLDLHDKKQMADKIRQTRAAYQHLRHKG